MEQSLTSTLVGEEDNETTHCSRQLGSSNKNKEQVALELNRLKDKAVRYKSHKDFLSQRVCNLNWKPHLENTTKNLLTRDTQS